MWITAQEIQSSTKKGIPIGTIPMKVRSNAKRMDDEISKFYFEKWIVAPNNGRSQHVCSVVNFVIYELVSFARQYLMSAVWSTTGAYAQWFGECWNVLVKHSFWHGPSMWMRWLQFTQFRSVNWQKTPSWSVSVSLSWQPLRSCSPSTTSATNRLVIFARKRATPKGLSLSRPAMSSLARHFREREKFSVSDGGSVRI